MKVQAYVDRLFDDYEDSPELREFKEEIAINLQERVAGLEAKGFSPDEAFEKSIVELGDITGIAEQISKQKRNEVICKMYFGSISPIGKMHAIGYVVAGGAVLLGLLMSLITFISTGELSNAITTHLLTFFALPGSVLVFLGLTQETARNLPMAQPRALLYAFAVALLLFGSGVSARLSVIGGQEPRVVFGNLAAFVIPGISLLAYLILTEKKRQKPWVLQEDEQLVELYTKKD